MNTKINFLGPETARCGGGLPRDGVVVKNFVLYLETLSSLGFEERNLGCPRNFAGMSRTPGGVQKVCAKQVRAHFSFPKSGLKWLYLVSPKRALDYDTCRLQIGLLTSPKPTRHSGCYCSSRMEAESTMDRVPGWSLSTCSQPKFSPYLRSQKRHSKPEIARKAPKNFLNNSRG